MPRPTPVLAALAALLLQACIVYDDDSPPAVHGNYAPYIDYAYAECSWDPSYGDYVWWFEADVDDPDGPGDIESVWADVYFADDGTLADGGFELLYYQGITYDSAWIGSSTYLDCTWPGYFVELTAYDYAGAYDVVSVDPVHIL